MEKIHTSEWVSLGHPDKVADYISEYLLDAYLEQDKDTRYAVEVQIKDNFVTLSGEVTSNAVMENSDIERIVREAVDDIGYNKKYQERFGKECTTCGDDLIITNHISKQSPDIATGVNKDAWGDQGIFFGYFCNETEEGQGIEYYLAKKIGKSLYDMALENPKLGLGIDIKTQVTVKFSGYGEFEITDIIVAIPSQKELKFTKLKKIIKESINEICPESKTAKIIINGTGEYHIHGPVGDCGTTGRKLVVDFYGSRSRIGGGSPWTKDGTKADLTLNIFSHECAKEFYNEIKKSTHECFHVETELSCCIGKQEVYCLCKAFDENDVLITTSFESQKVKPSVLIKRYNLKNPIFRKLCKYGIFSIINKNKLN